MDYEKRYNEALEDMRVVYPNLNGDAKLAIEHAFPELAESEDERIRKLLVWQVHRNIEDETNDLAGSVYDGVKGHDPDLEESIEDWKKCLAWLEKQKEQKPAEWSDTNELVFQDICKHLKEEGYGEWVVLLNALRNGEFQPKQEWSEKDKKTIEGMIVDYKGEIEHLSDSIIDEQVKPIYREYLSFLYRLKTYCLESYNNDVQRIIEDAIF